MVLAEHQTELAMRAGGDSGALAELIAEMDKPTWRMIHKGMPRCPKEDKEDMYQEIMTALCHNIVGFKGASKFYTWFTRLMLNKIADYYRRASRNKLIFMAQPYDIDNEPSVEPEWSSINTDIISKLPKPYKKVLGKWCIYGMNIAEIAESEHVSYEAIRCRQRRGIQYIRRRFTEGELR